MIVYQIMDTILEQLFNSNVRAKVLKLFFRNDQKDFQINEVSERTQTDYYAARREVLKLKKIGILKGANKYRLNSDFEFLGELRNLILRSSPISKDKLQKKLNKIGKFKMVLLSGVFIGEDKTRVDLFLVGNNVNERALERFLQDIEAEVGKEIDYVLFSEDDFRYRKNMFDKLVLEILEGHKQILVDKFGFT